MSILFEAWRRARGKESRLSETLGAPPVVAAPRRSLIPWLICFALAAVAVGLAVYLWRTHGSRPPQPVAATVSANSVPVAKRPAAAPAAAVPKAVAIVPQPLPPPAATSVAHPVVAANVEPQANVSTRDAPARAVATDTSQVAAAPVSPSANGAVPEDVREALPIFTVAVHVWNEDPSARFVMIGGQVYRTGDEIASGVKLLQITQTGEIVGFRGYRIELPGG